MDDDGHGDDNNKEVVHGKNDEKEVIVLTITLITVEYIFKLVYFPPFVIIIPCDR